VASHANRSSGWGGGCFEDQCCGRWDRTLAVRRGVRLLVLIARTGPTPATESSAPRASEPCPKRRLFAGSGRSFGGVWSSCSWLPAVQRLPVEKGSFQIRNRLPYVSDRLSVLRTTHGSVRPFRRTVGREWFLTSGSCAAHRARRLFLTVGPNSPKANHRQNSDLDFAPLRERLADISIRRPRGCLGSSLERRSPSGSVVQHGCRIGICQGARALSHGSAARAKFVTAAATDRSAGSHSVRIGATTCSSQWGPRSRCGPPASARRVRNARSPQN
jgi:hypothetical protein